MLAINSDFSTKLMNLATSPKISVAITLNFTKLFHFCKLNGEMAEIVIFMLSFHFQAFYFLFLHSAWRKGKIHHQKHSFPISLLNKNNGGNFLCHFNFFVKLMNFSSDMDFLTKLQKIPSNHRRLDRKIHIRPI